MKQDTTVMLPLCLMLACLVVTEAFLSSTPVTLSTTHGDVNGARKSVGTGLPTVEVFYGIPFAEPPTRNLRFRPPVPKAPWGEIDGTVMPRACWQTNDTMYGRFPGVDMWNPNTGVDEDCLYLNVWRPETAGGSFAGSGDGESSSNGAGGHKTIMVWIFGGGFYSGSPVLGVYEPSQLAVRKDVIVVTIGYRVGPFGFLYLGNDDVPGNAGLLDQAMALQWVKDNAVNLGGSPDDITIFGESAGAASVGFHLFSPASRDLFNNAIMQSTTPLAHWAVMDTTKALGRARTLASLVSCDNTDSDAMLDCLQHAAPLDLANQQWSVATAWFDTTFAPVVDGTFLPDHPANMLAAGDIKQTDVIVGVNKDEGIYFDLYGFQNVFSNLSRGGVMSDAEFESIMLSVANDNASFRDQLIDAYTTTEGGNHLNIVDATSGDVLFKCSVVDFAREYTRVGGRVYMYSFEENFSSNPWPDWMGVPHGYEIEVIFGQPLTPGSINTQSEKELSLKVMDLWTNFARTGNPNSNNDEEITSTEWPEYTLENKQYVIIDASGLHTEQRLRCTECQLWSSQVDQGTVVAVPDGQTSEQVDSHVQQVLESPGYELVTDEDNESASNWLLESIGGVDGQNIVVDAVIPL